MAKNYPPFPHQYPYIRAWGTLLQSYEYYIRSEIELAQKEKAPPDAIYKDSNGKWHRWSEMKDDNPNKLTIKEYAKNFEKVPT